MSARYVYSGGSWATRSLDHVGGTTNLAQEWGIPSLDHARDNTSTLERVEFLRGVDPHLPVIFVYIEPLTDLEHITGVTAREFLQREDWRQLRDICDQHCLSALNDLARPVGLIGACDISRCDFPNITVLDASWNRHMAQEAGMTVTQRGICVEPGDGGNFWIDQCWNAELVHRTMHACPDIAPQRDLVDSIWDMFFFWQELEKHGLFRDCHPTRKSAESYAKLLDSTVRHWLEQYQ